MKLLIMQSFPAYHRSFFLGTNIFEALCSQTPSICVFRLVWET